MFFGPVAIAEAEGGILAHSHKVGGRKLGKGHVLAAGDVAALRAAGVERLVIARLGPGDVGEDAAAGRLAAALVPDPVAAGLRIAEAFTGRVNLHATGPGVVDIDAEAINALNAVDPAITLATVAPLVRVARGTLVGTVKIIAYGVDEKRLSEAEAVARGAIRVRPVMRRSAGLILTEVEGQTEKLNAKAREVTGRRLRALGMELAGSVAVPHEAGAIAAALEALPGDIALILTGSATSDPLDVGPQGVRQAGGEVIRFGIPVDPGNLLFLGQLGERPVIGLPGCARSPALNGADWVLERIACGIEISAADMAAMGVGGLLKEIPVRPQPREG